MSQENVEIVRGLYEAFARRDGVAPFEAYAPDIEWDTRGFGHIDVTTTYHGHDEVRASFRELLLAFREFEFQLGEFRDVGDHVLVTVDDRGVGRASGVVVHRRHYALWTLREGKVVRMRVYLDQTEALEALGLEA